MAGTAQHRTAHASARGKHANNQKYLKVPDYRLQAWKLKVFSFAMHHIHIYFTLTVPLSSFAGYILDIYVMMFDCSPGGGVVRGGGGGLGGGGGGGVWPDALELVLAACPAG